MSGVTKAQQLNLLRPNLKTLVLQLTYGATVIPFPTGNYRIWSIALHNSDTENSAVYVSLPYPSFISVIPAPAGGLGLDGPFLSLEDSPLDITLAADPTTATFMAVTISYEEVPYNAFGHARVSVPAATNTLLVPAPSEGIYRSLSWCPALTWALDSYRTPMARLLSTASSQTLSSYINSDLAQRKSALSMVLIPGLSEGQALYVRAEDSVGVGYAIWEDIIV